VLKEAETTCEKVVFPSIQELRYAGRRLIDGLNVLFEEGREDKALDLLRDALFDCHRARHDAVDAVHSKVTGDMRLAVEYLGRDVVLSIFPEITEVQKLLHAIGRELAEAREDRRDRDRIYKEIIVDDFRKLIGLHAVFLENEPAMKEMAARQRRAYDAAIEAVRIAEQTRDEANSRAEEAARLAERARVEAVAGAAEANRIARRNLWVAVFGGIVALLSLAVAGAQWMQPAQTVANERAATPQTLTPTVPPLPTPPKPRP
jgi:hypothetical protein